MLVAAFAAAGVSAIPMIGSRIAAVKDDPARVVAQAGKKKGGQGDDRSAAKGDNGQGNGGKKKHPGPKKK